MAETKIWIGQSATDTSTTAGDYEGADNWKPISLVNATYKWTVSGFGTGEYYLEAAGGGTPGIAQPTNVQQRVGTVPTNMTAGTAGTLAAGEWDWADNDTLGFSTVYVRLTGGTDPDASDDDHVTFTAPPLAGDAVVCNHESINAITSNMEQSDITIASFTVTSGATSTVAIGTDYLPLRIATSGNVKLAGRGTIYLDIGSSAVDVIVDNTASPTTGKRGLYLQGSAIDELLVQGGYVGLAWRQDESATVSKVRIANGASCWIGDSVTISTNVRQFSGADCRCDSAATITLNGGTMTTAGSGAVTCTIDNNATLVSNSTGTLTATLNWGTLDLNQYGAARTVALTWNVRGATKLIADEGVITFSSFTRASGRAITYTAK